MSITSLIATFDGVSLTSVDGVSILGTDPYKPGKRTLSQYVLARTNKRNTNSAFYTNKQIAVRTSITATTRAAVEERFDQLMAILQGLKKDLVLSQSAGVRRYVCTLADISWHQSGGAYLEFDLIFSCDETFGSDMTATTVLSLSGVTSSTRGDQIAFGGSAPWQQPLIIVQYTAITAGTNEDVVIGNPATGQSVTITRNWETGDRLEIDVANATVKVNGYDVEFDGALPEWKVGTGNWSYSDSLTTRTFSATITYYKRYV